MNFKNKTLYTMSAVLSTFLLSGCGGGGGGSSSTVESSTYTISGTVPGTIIEAFCTDGSYYKVNSTDDGTSNHPFELILPKDLECKIVMTTNEDDANESNWIVTPITLNGDTNLIVDKDVLLGQVTLATSGSGGVREVLDISHSEATTRTLDIDSMDDDHDGVPNIYEDDDGDGLLNHHDDDDDNDGVKDIAETTNDHDGDGILDINDKDDDNDGIDDSRDDDRDNDGIRDSEDDDDDGDGIVDDDDHDHDNDGIDDENDRDSDNDGHDDVTGDSYDTNNYTTNITLPDTFAADDGRLLASQCAQCHGTNGISSNSWDSIKNEDDNIKTESFDDLDELIMGAQADGYTADEANAIQTWLNNQ
jgi:hypothetical protein